MDFDKKKTMIKISICQLWAIIKLLDSSIYQEYQDINLDICSEFTEDIIQHMMKFCDIYQKSVNSLLLVSRPYETSKFLEKWLLKVLVTC